MFDLSAYQPFVVGFFLVAAVGAGLAVATLVVIVREGCTGAGRVVPVPAVHPAVLAARRAA
jgi:hypothetical protein